MLKIKQGQHVSVRIEEYGSGYSLKLYPLDNESLHEEADFYLTDEDFHNVVNGRTIMVKAALKQV